MGVNVMKLSMKGNSKYWCMCVCVFTRVCLCMGVWVDVYMNECIYMRTHTLYIKRQIYLSIHILYI